MEPLLARAFDYLSSYDQQKIRKGLRQVEGLLAQICLMRSAATGAGAGAGAGAGMSPAERRRSAMMISANGHGQGPAKPLEALPADPVFCEFFRLQDGFQWNVTLRLIACLEHLLAHGADGTNDLLLLATLDLLQGVLLLHPPSRALFARESHMNLLLDLLEPANCPAVQSATLLALVAALLDHPDNTRAFEDLDGLLTVSSLFKLRATSKEVKMKLVEFLYFYLMAETPAPGYAQENVAGGAAVVGGVAGRRGSAFVGGGPETRTMEDKQELLGRYLSNVDDLVEDLRETAPFGGSVY